MWDIPILIFAYVLFWGPKTVEGRADTSKRHLLESAKVDALLSRGMGGSGEGFRVWVYYRGLNNYQFHFGGSLLYL